MAATKKRNAKEKRKTVTEETIKAANSVLVTLGDEVSTSSYESAVSTDGALSRLTYDSPQNLYAIVHPAFLAVAEHWLEFEDENKKVVCGAHLTGDWDLIGSKYGYPDGCRVCAIKKALYDEAPRDSKDVVDIRKRDIAYSIQAKLIYYMFVVRGAERRDKQRGSVVIRMDFDTKNVRKLMMTKSAFDVFLEGFKENGFTTEDAIGLPVNFVGEKGKGGYSKIIRVDFYPEERIKDLPKAKYNFSGLDSTSIEQIDEISKKWEKEMLPKLIAGIKNKKKKEKGTKSGKRKR